MASEELSGATGDAKERTHTHVPIRDSDHRILTRLQKRRDWVIPDRSWDSAPEFLQTFLEDDENEVRERISSARTLVMMSNSTVAAQSVEVRINQAIAVTTPPETPEDVDVEIQPAFIEVIVSPDDLEETVNVLETYGLMSRYVEQVKTQSVIPSNGSANTNGNGKTSGKPTN